MASRTPVGAEVVGEDDVMRLQGRRKDLLDIGEECFTVHWAVYYAGRGERADTQGCDERRRLPMPVWDLGDEPLTARSPAAKPSSGNAENGGRSSSYPRRHSLSDDRGPAPDSNVTGWVLPHCFVHDVQRRFLVVRFGDHRVAVL